MELHLRQIVDKSVTTLKNFFMGFLTFDQLKVAVGGRPLRLIRPIVTRESIPAPKARPNVKTTRAHEQEAKERGENPTLAA